MSADIIKPLRLNKGDTIGILSPSYALSPQVVGPSIDRLETMGYKVKAAKNTFKTTYGYAASAEERAEDFNAMISDSEVKMLLFGGGEVCNEILPLVDYDSVRKHPKIICSYSDSTTILNAVSALSCVETFYGQSLRTFLNPTEYNLGCFESAFCCNDMPVYRQNSEWECVNGGECEGILVGGYLVNFAVMINGAYFRYDSGAKYLLFLEDHITFSEPAVVSKYLSHIEQSGFMKNVSGLIFGHYSDKPEPMLIDILTRFTVRHKIPAVKCGDFGHGLNNTVMPIGIRARLDAGNCSFSFLENLCL